MHIHSMEVEDGNIDREGQSSSTSILKYEFQKNKIWLSHPQHEIFYRTQWDWPQLVYMLYRIAVAIYILAWLIESIIFMPTFNGHVWPAFLTNWSYTVLTVYLFVAAGVVIRRNGGSVSTDRPPSLQAQKPEQDRNVDRPLPMDLKIEWALFAIVSNFSFIVTLIYFAILYPVIYGEKNNPTGKSILAVDLHIHGINSVVVLMEMLISAYPVRLLHCVYPIAYGLTYVLFSLVYWAIDHNNVVYKNVLDWNKPGSTIGVVLGLGFVVIPLFQLLLFGIYRLRIWLYEKFCQREKVANNSPDRSDSE